jgi:hypothetical protein
MIAADELKAISALHMGSPKVYNYHIARQKWPPTNKGLCIVQYKIFFAVDNHKWSCFTDIQDKIVMH